LPSMVTSWSSGIGSPFARTMARVSTDADAAAQVVELLLAFLTAAVFYTESRTDPLGRNADSRQASGHPVAKAGFCRLFADALATVRH